MGKSSQRKSANRYDRSSRSQHSHSRSQSSLGLSKETGNIHERIPFHNASRDSGLVNVSGHVSNDGNAMLHGLSFDGQNQLNQSNMSQRT